MNQTSEWRCKISSLQHFTRAEHIDLSTIVNQLDGIESERRVEYDAIQYDLNELMNCYV